MLDHGALTKRLLMLMLLIVLGILGAAGVALLLLVCSEATARASIDGWIDDEDVHCPDCGAPIRLRRRGRRVVTYDPPVATLLGLRTSEHRCSGRPVAPVEFLDPGHLVFLKGRNGVRCDTD